MNRWLLGLCFFASGATSLALEVAWAKELSYILGNTLYAVSTVVAAFMAGLGLGSGLAGRYAQLVRTPVMAYAAMEWVIALCGMVSIPLFRSTEPLFRVLYNTLEPGHGTFLLARFAVVFVVMMVPVTLMGMTLPVVVGAYGRRKKKYDFEAGMLYGVNTLGAVTGTLAAGFVLVPWLGLLKTCIAVGVTDGVVGVVAWFIHRRVGVITDVRTQEAAEATGIERGKEPEEKPGGKAGRRGWTGLQGLIGGVFLVSGAVAMVYEVGWFRLLALVLGPSVHAFSVMLAMFLVGVGLGSVAAAKWAQTTKRPLMVMAGMEAAIGLTALATMAFYNELPEWYFALFQTVASGRGAEWSIAAQGVIAGMVVLLPTLGMGAMFPVAVRAFREAAREGMRPEGNVGGLYVLNTIGGIVGSLAAGFWLVPGIGMWRTVLIASGMSVGLGIILCMAVREVRIVPKAAFALTAAVGVVAGMAILPGWNALLLNQGLYREMSSVEKFNKRVRLKGQSMLFYREGVNTTVAILRSPGNVTLRVSGKADASSFTPDLYTQLFSGQLPVLFARNPRRVAVIGFGSGMTAGTMLRHPSIESLDILEIEEGVMEGSTLYFKFLNGDPVADPRSRLVLEDGRTQMTYTDKVYDIITSEPSNPWIAGVSNLFTADFYKLVSARLAPDGIFCQWLQLYEVSEETFKVVLATLHEVFPHVAIFMSRLGDSVILASREPITIQWETLEERFNQEDVRKAFYDFKIRNPLELLFFFLAGTDEVEKYIADTVERNTDDNVWLEHRMPYDFFKVGRQSIGVDLLERFAKSKAAGLKKTVPGIPMEEAVEAIINHMYLSGLEIKNKTSVYDYWRERREPIVSGFLDAFEEKGDEAMVENIRAWKEEGEKHNEVLLQATIEVVRALKNPEMQKEPAQLKTFLKEALDKAPDLPYALVASGALAFREQDYTQAEGHFRKTLEYPWSRLSYYSAATGLAETLENQERLDEALTYARIAKKKNPYYPNAFEIEARLLHRRGETEAALKLLKEGLFYNPGETTLLKARRDFRSGYLPPGK
ncbi:MAG: fused MFS/spermidine synthase [Acidobacteriota bacterium]|nr:MAG: fused MFS/spermidine synthase [Acidobacteriota bacterium]